MEATGSSGPTSSAEGMHPRLPFTISSLVAPAVPATSEPHAQANAAGEGAAATSLSLGQPANLFGDTTVST